MHVLDSSFREAKRRRQLRRRKRLIVRAAIIGICLIFGLFAGWSYFEGTVSTEEVVSDLDEDLAPVELALPDAEQPAPSYVPKVLDLMGDPLSITLEQGRAAETRARPIERTQALERFVPTGQVYLLSDTMVTSSERFMANLPSTQEDFAFFRAQQSLDLQPSPAEPPPDDLAAEPGVGAAGTEAVSDGDATEAGDPAFTEDDAAAGWGETISDGEEALPAFEPTRIENTTSIALLKPDYDRAPTQQDIFVSILSKRSLANVLTENGFDAAQADAAMKAMSDLFKLDELEGGMIVAARGLRTDKAEARWSVGQVSIYRQRNYLGTIARGDDAGFAVGADPWLEKDLFAISNQGGPPKQYRLLDAIFSTAIRNGVPSGVVGEAIMLLSRGHDLNALATPKDRLVLIYGDAARDSSAGASGRVLYAAVKRETDTLECYVYRPPGKSDFDCLTKSEITEQSSIATGPTANGMVTPVNGVMTSTFGPRRHPILKAVRIHKGVDWAAPIGTPVVAAFDGTIAYAGDGKGYGNVVKIDHPGNRSTRYAHLSRFGEKAKVGAAIKAGEVIGYIGTTGLSTGPHLHFELYVGSQAVDPLRPNAAPDVPAYQVARSQSRGGDDAAVATLVNKIIKVESGANPRAKNPLSSATGLGQFISSTWVRMMQNYRPDLARSLSRADLLALRYDPTISREMVRNLALEGEAYLRARGHSITAGRLYLCHFLGMEGAHIVLAASAERSIVDVLGYQVIQANPFLQGHSAGYVIEWAERKMLGRSAPRSALQDAPPPEPAAPATVTRADPDFEAYKAAMQTIVKESGALL